MNIKGHDGKYYDRSREEEYRKNYPGTNEIKTKECNRCKKFLPVTTENFYKKKDCKDGFTGICIKCRKKEYLEKKNLKKTNKSKVEEKETEILSKETEILNKESIYEWVKSLPEDKKALLDPLKISAKIKEELFGK